jgi:hypothetical protein
MTPAPASPIQWRTGAARSAANWGAPQVERAGRECTAATAGLDGAVSSGESVDKIMRTGQQLIGLRSGRRPGHQFGEFLDESGERDEAIARLLDLHL